MNNIVVVCFVLNKMNGAQDHKEAGGGAEGNKVEGKACCHLLWQQHTLNPNNFIGIIASE